MSAEHGAEGGALDPHEWAEQERAFGKPPVEQGAQPASDLSALPGLLPYERMAVSNLKVLNAKRLRELQHALVIERHSEALAVIVPMDWYCKVVDFLNPEVPRG